jgi:hypothetical protein
MLSTSANRSPFMVAVLALGMALAFRLPIESIWLLPSPVGDPAYFLTASANYCRSGFLGTTAFPIDPSGHSRMVWHGFVSPMLFGAMNFACKAPTYYVMLWGIKALTIVGIVLLAHRRLYPTVTLCGLAWFTLAAQSLIGFRPETLAIFLIVLTELAFELNQHVLLGAVLGTLLCTQPTVAGLHALVLLIARPKLLRRHWLQIGVGYASAVLVLMSLYPYPVSDLITGIQLHAKLLFDRSDGSLLGYYVLVPFLPAWSVLFLAAWALAAVRNPLLIALGPALWFFGPRLPPTYYNLIPICLVLMVVASTQSSRRAAHVLGATSLVVGALGLGFLTARDVLTIYRYGDTFRSTSVAVAQLVTQGATFEQAPAFLALTNPALGVTDPNGMRGTTSSSEKPEMRLYSVNGRPRSPCPGTQPSLPVSLAIGHVTLFNSNSGWMVYPCHVPD